MQLNQTLISINELLLYDNKDLMNRYKKDYPNNHLENKVVLNELLKYFWLSFKHEIDKKNHPENKKLNFQCVIYHEMREIDDMWHTFLLFTKEYMCFCKKYFKIYIHHFPLSINKPHSKKFLRKELTNYLSYIYDNLGEETVIMWFGDR